MSKVSYETLEANNRELANRLFKIEVDSAKAAQHAASEATAQAEATANAERHAEQQKKMEESRVAVWLKHYVDAGVAEDPNVLFETVMLRAKRNTPASGWPPGYDAASMGYDAASRYIAADVEETSLWRKAKAMGCKI